MRKIYLTLAAAVFTMGAMAQMPRLVNATKKVNVAAAKNFTGNATGPVKSTNANQNFYLDYSAANFDDAGYVWAFNSNYVTADTLNSTATQINYAAIGITNPLAGYSDPADPTGTWLEYPYFNGPITIDSIFASLSHENNSGEYDKIIMEIVTLDNSFKPTSTVLWSQTDSSNTSLSTGGNWVGTGAGFTLSYNPAYVSSNGQKLGLNLRYVGNKLDTFSISAGFVDNGSGGSDNQSNYKNSWTRIPPFIPNVTLNSNIGYGSPVGSQGWFEAQNWFMWAYVTYDVTGITENEFIKGVKIGQSYPNPANKVTNFFYELQKPTSVTFEVYDMNGRLVKEFKEGVKESGKHIHTINVEQFDSGVYFYTIKTNETSVTKRMVITK